MMHCGDQSRCGTHPCAGPMPISSHVAVIGGTTRAVHAVMPATCQERRGRYGTLPGMIEAARPPDTACHRVARAPNPRRDQIGRASCRERGEMTEVDGRVERS